jgi:hypothetical protein
MMEKAAPLATAPALVAGTLAGQTHELGAMLAAAAASSHGWRVVYLGANLTATEIAVVANHTRANAVALSLVHPADELMRRRRRILRRGNESREVEQGGHRGLRGRNRARHVLHAARHKFSGKLENLSSLGGQFGRAARSVITDGRDPGCHHLRQSHIPFKTKDPGPALLH